VIGSPAAASPLPPTSLIICTRNRGGMLADTVESILAGDTLPDEIIIVDQSDCSAEPLSARWRDRGSDIRYVWTRAVGLSHANNVGVATARHNVLVFTHDDVRVAASWFSTLVRALMEAGPRCVITGKVPPGEPERPGGFQQTLRVEEHRKSWQGRTRASPLLVLNMALERSVYESVGGFDERLGPGTVFPGAEDVDLGFRVLEAGYRILYEPDAVVYHRAWRAPESYLSIRWDYGMALGGYFGKHLSVRDRWILRNLAGVLRYRTWRGIRTIRSDARRSQGDFASVTAILVGLVRWWRLHGLSRSADAPSPSRRRADEADGRRRGPC
jgi:GT2 family glycosyltransferase